jgi:hypothetical protein
LFICVAPWLELARPELAVMPRCTKKSWRAHMPYFKGFQRFLIDQKITNHVLINSRARENLSAYGNV